MMMTGAKAHFCAGHKLPQHSGIHGHSYEVWAYTIENVCVEEWQSALRSVCADLDHTMLNYVLQPPTMEKIALYVAERMPKASAVRVVRPVEGLCAEWSQERGKKP